MSIEDYLEIANSLIKRHQRRFSRKSDKPAELVLGPAISNPDAKAKIVAAFNAMIREHDLHAHVVAAIGPNNSLLLASDVARDNKMWPVSVKKSGTLGKHGIVTGGVKGDRPIILDTQLDILAEAAAPLPEGQPLRILMINEDLRHSRTNATAYLFLTTGDEVREELPDAVRKVRARIEKSKPKGERTEPLPFTAGVEVVGELVVAHQPDLDGLEAGIKAGIPIIASIFQYQPTKPGEYAEIDVPATARVIESLKLATDEVVQGTSNARVEAAFSVPRPERKSRPIRKRLQGDDPTVSKK